MMTFSEEFDELRFFSEGGKWDPAWWYKPEGVLSGSSWLVNPQYEPTAAANPFSIKDGVLTISAQASEPALRQYMDGAEYTGGQLNTYHAFAQTYGYFEMRAQMPAGKGPWAAFWLLPKDGSWPPEIDVVEALGRDPTSVHTTLHSTVSGDHKRGANHYQTDGHEYKVADLTTGFHTYGVDWQPDDTTWYFDGEEIFKTKTPADASKDMFMVVNNGFGGEGTWFGAPDATTPLPADMKIDYIRAYTELPVDPPSESAAASSDWFI